MHVYLCDFLLDIAQNSLEANSKLVEIIIDETRNGIDFVVKDNGKGMTEEQQRKVKDPFYTDGVKHKKRKVGLGIPFVMQVSKTFSLQSSPGVGTTVEFGFDLTDIDTPPLGDIPSTLLAIFTHPACVETVVSRKLATDYGSDSYTVRRSDLTEVLGELNTSGNMNLAKEFLVSQEEALACLYEEPTLCLETPQEK